MGCFLMSEVPLQLSLSLCKRLKVIKDTKNKRKKNETLIILKANTANTHTLGYDPFI